MKIALIFTLLAASLTGCASIDHYYTKVTDPGYYERKAEEVTQAYQTGTYKYEKTARSEKDVPLVNYFIEGLSAFGGPPASSKSKAMSCDCHNGTCWCR